MKHYIFPPLLCSCFSSTCLRKQRYTFTSLRGIWWIHTSLQPVSQINITVDNLKARLILTLGDVSVSLPNIPLCFKMKEIAYLSVYIYLYTKYTGFKMCKYSGNAGDELIWTDEMLWSRHKWGIFLSWMQLRLFINSENFCKNTTSSCFTKLTRIMDGNKYLTCSCAFWIWGFGQGECSGASLMRCKQTHTTPRLSMPREKKW